MSNFRFKINHYSWKAVFILGMCIMFTMSCSRNAFFLKHGMQPLVSSHDILPKTTDQIGTKPNRYTTTLVKNLAPDSKETTLLVSHTPDSEENGTNKNRRPDRISTIPDENQPSSVVEAIQPETVKQGRLLFNAGEGSYREAPRLQTNVDIMVSGLIARVTVKQRFENPTNVWQEGIYVFPLPENAAVDHLKMQVADKMIEGEIKPREEANEIYQQAKQAGQKASLLEQQRPNIFTTSVANIGPNDSITVQIEYQHTVRYSDAKFSLRFPMVVSPRYTLPPIIEETPAQPNAAGFVNTMEVQHISPPIASPTQSPINPITLRVELNSGMPLAKIHCLYHACQKTAREDGHIVIELGDGNYADRDFVLEWQPETGQHPKAALFTEEKPGQHYFMLMILPSAVQSADTQRLPREGIFVIDTSGSMKGHSIAQAKAALSYALKRLRSGDRFNVIQFNDSASSLFSAAEPVNENTIATALRYVANLKAGGGTEMAEALAIALNGESQPGIVRQVVFLTDGSVTNESQLFEIIHHRLGDSRLFTVGIGSAPNSFFMHKAAQFGRGTFTYIGKTSEVGAQMNELFSKLETPIMTQLKIHWPDGVTAEMWPRRLPDIYQGEPLVIKARLDRAEGEVIVTGQLAGSQWRSRMNLKIAANDSGVGVLWARAKIAALMESLYEGAAPDEVKKSVIEVALAHHLVSNYTSLVAVDKSESRTSEQEPDSHTLPVNLPYGMEQANQKTPNNSSMPYRPQRNNSRFDLMTQWWNNNLWGGQDARNDIAAARSVRTSQLTIPLLSGDQKIVGTGKRPFYLGWSGKDNQSSSYIVTIKRKGSPCLIGRNCWEGTTSNNFIIFPELNLKKGHYVVKVTDGNQSTIGEFTVIASPPSFFPIQYLTEEQQIGWALELLTHGKYQWTLEAYQQVAGITDEKAQQIKEKLAEGLTILMIRQR